MVTLVMCRFGRTFLVSFGGFGKIARSSKDSCFENLNAQTDTKPQFLPAHILQEPSSVESANSLFVNLLALPLEKKMKTF